MTAALLRRSGVGGKPPVRRELVEQCWDDFVRARAKAMTSRSVEAGIAAGRAWGAFLRLFEKT